MVIVVSRTKNKRMTKRQQNDEQDSSGDNQQDEEQNGQDMSKMEKGRLRRKSR